MPSLSTTQNDTAEARAIFEGTNGEAGFGDMNVGGLSRAWRGDPARVARWKLAAVAKVLVAHEVAVYTCMQSILGGGNMSIGDYNRVIRGLDQGLSSMRLLLGRDFGTKNSFRGVYNKSSHRTGRHARSGAVANGVVQYNAAINHLAAACPVDVVAGFEEKAILFIARGISFCRCLGLDITVSGNQTFDGEASESVVGAVREYVVTNLMGASPLAAFALFSNSL